MQAKLKLPLKETREWKVCVSFQCPPWSPRVTACNCTCRRACQSWWKCTLRVKAAGLAPLLENDVKPSSSRKGGWGPWVGGVPLHPIALSLGLWCYLSWPLYLCVYGQRHAGWSRLLLSWESAEVNRTLHASHYRVLRCFRLLSCMSLVVTSLLFFPSLPLLCW